MIKDTEYTELENVTKKQEYEEIGWSVFDASMIYKRKSTLFNISDGVIKVYYEYVNADGTEYRAKVYRNFHNGFTYI
jgi:hypothetical protein